MPPTEVLTPDAGGDGRPFLVLGTTEFSVTLAGTAEEAGCRVAGFVENLSFERSGRTLEGRPVYWIEDVGKLATTHVAVCGLGTTRRSRFVEQATERGLHFATVVHPTAYLAAGSVLDTGCYVGPQALLDPGVVLGRHALVLQGSLVGRDTEIGAYASILMGANIGSSCRVGEATYVATGAVVVDGVRVGSGSVVGAGAVVLEDVPDHVQVVGVPARVVKEGIEGR